MKPEDSFFILKWKSFEDRYLEKAIGCDHCDLLQDIMIFMRMYLDHIQEKLGGEQSEL